jgi:uncharacterized protein YggT (Ycf19 family)
MEQEQRVVREEPAASSAEETNVVSRFSPARRAYETIYLIFAIIAGGIFIRVLLKVLGANTAVAFTHFMYGVTDPFLAPFRGLLPTFASGRMILETSALFAILIYGLIGIALARLLAIMFMRDVTVSAHGRRSRPIRPNPD